MPCASDKRVIDVWDLKAHNCNSTTLQQYLVAKSIHCPARIKSQYEASVTDSRTAGARLGKRTVDRVAEVAAGACEPGPDAKQPRPRSADGDLV